jgi:hypothetical protein
MIIWLLDYAHTEFDIDWINFWLVKVVVEMKGLVSVSAKLVCIVGAGQESPSRSLELNQFSMLRQSLPKMVIRVSKGEPA